MDLQVLNTLVSKLLDKRSPPFDHIPLFQPRISLLLKSSFPLFILHPSVNETCPHSAYSDLMRIIQAHISRGGRRQIHI